MKTSLKLENLLQIYLSPLRQLNKWTLLLRKRLSGIENLAWNHAFNLLQFLPISFAKKSEESRYKAYWDFEPPIRHLVTMWPSQFSFEKELLIRCRLEEEFDNTITTKKTTKKKQLLQKAKGKKYLQESKRVPYASKRALPPKYH
jgi:hypothetical protein